MAALERVAALVRELATLPGVTVAVGGSLAVSVAVPRAESAPPVGRDEAVEQWQREHGTDIG